MLAVVVAGGGVVVVVVVVAVVAASAPVFGGSEAPKALNPQNLEFQTHQVVEIKLGQQTPVFLHYRRPGLDLPAKGKYLEVPFFGGLLG